MIKAPVVPSNKSTSSEIPSSSKDKSGQKSDVAGKVPWTEDDFMTKPAAGGGGGENAWDLDSD
jgi:hypothetical protein